MRSAVEVEAADHATTIPKIPAGRLDPRTRKALLGNFPSEKFGAPRMNALWGRVIAAFPGYRAKWVGAGPRLPMAWCSSHEEPAIGVGAARAARRACSDARPLTEERARRSPTLMRASCSSARGSSADQKGTDPLRLLLHLIRGADLDQSEVKVLIRLMTSLGLFELLAALSRVLWGEVGGRW